MPTKRIFDASGGVVSVIETDTLARTTTIANYQDTEPYLDRNKRLQSEGDGWSPTRELKRVASIPNVVLAKMCKDDGVSLLDFMRRPKAYRGWLRGKLADPDYRHLLTAPQRSTAGTRAQFIIR